ncbi:MAG: copper chaperone PCu(A)C [Streptosporangiales bacterium]
MSPHALTRPVALVVVSLAMAFAVSGCASGFETYTSPSLQPPDANNYPAVGSTSPIEVKHAFVLGPRPDDPPYVKGSDAAVYLTFVNETKKTDTLVSASSPAARKVTIAGGTSAGTGIEVPPTNSAVTKGAPVDVGRPPYSDNTITLTGLSRDVRNTEVLSLTLTFRRAGKITFDIPVMPRTAEYATLQPAPGSTPGPTPEQSASTSPASPTPTITGP